MLQLVDGFGWCQFGNSTLRSNTNFKGLGIGSGFFNGDTVGMGILSGNIITGPYPGNKGIEFVRAEATPPDGLGNTGWFQGYNLPGGASNWICAMHVRPVSVTGRQTFFWLSALEPPNFLGNMCLAVNGSGQLEVIHFTGDIQMNTLGFTNVASVATLPDSTWTHICVRYIAATGPSNGRITIWINGNLDTDRTGLNLNSSTKISQAYLVWQSNAITTKMGIANLVICDDQGTVNNTQIPATTQIRTFNGSSDIDNGNWTPHPSGPNFSCVDVLSGPGSTYIDITNLTNPDELFGIPFFDDGGTVMGLNSSFTMANGPGDIKPLVKIAGNKYVIGPALTANVQANVNALTESSPATGQPWTDREITGAAWGCRANSGVSEKVYQAFWEKVWYSGGGPYTFGG